MGLCTRFELRVWLDTIIYGDLDHLQKTLAASRRFPSTHYASRWSELHEIRDADSVTDVAIRYVRCKNAKKKQDLLLQLCQYFHSYVFKYVSMIVSGSLPRTGNRINSDIKEFLKLFVPYGEKVSGLGLIKIARTLYVAFKNMEVAEVYNVLEGCLIKTLNNYDPDYMDKVRAVVVAVEEQSALHALFTAKQITDRVGFESQSICKMLVKRGHLVRAEKETSPDNGFCWSEL